MASSINPLGSNTAANISSTPAAAAAPAVDKNMFLQLLVAQIRNQNPLQPTDGVEFLSQLATFTSMEQLAGMHEDLTAIRQTLTAQAAGSAENTPSTQIL
jgi:flagellar basal-body rod modification protein FlgD